MWVIALLGVAIVRGLKCPSSLVQDLRIAFPKVGKLFRDLVLPQDRDKIRQCLDIPLTYQSEIDKVSCAHS
jgi:hypothetical protein